MKYFKLGLLAATLSLTAFIIVMDKKNSIKNEDNIKSENNEEENSHTIIIENCIQEEN